MLRKKFEPSEFEGFCRSSAAAYLALLNQYSIAMKVLPVKGAEYRKICRAGQETGYLITTIIDQAYDLGYSKEKIDEMFGDARLVGCSLN